MTQPFVPDQFEAPRAFGGSGFRLEPLGPNHNERDHEAWMSSIEHIRSTPGMDWGSWPEPMSLEQNLDDMEMHAAEFEAREGFTYSILDGDEVIGCLYILPDKRDEVDAHVRSWVRESRSEMDVVVYRDVRDWLSSAWPFDRVEYAPR